MEVETGEIFGNGHTDRIKLCEAALEAFWSERDGEYVQSSRWYLDREEIFIIHELDIMRVSNRIVGLRPYQLQGEGV